MRAGKLARWAWRPAGVAIFGVAVALGGASSSHAQEAADADLPKWESDDDGEEQTPADPHLPKWEGEGPDGFVSPLIAKWE